MFFIFSYMKKNFEIDISHKPTYLEIKTRLSCFEVFKKIEAHFTDCFLFESLGSSQNNNNRYSLIGFKPDYVIKAKNNILNIDATKTKVKNPYESLAKLMPNPILTQEFAGGLIGYMSYEAANYFEPPLKLKIHPDFDQFCFGVFTDGLVFDNLTGKTSYFYYKKSRINIIEKILKSNTKNSQPPKITKMGQSMSKEEHAKTVRQVLKQIRAGNTFQCEVGLKVGYKVLGSLILVYESLRQINPSPYMYFLKFGKQTIIGSSPELLFSLKQKLMSTYPLAGTIRRGKQEQEDKTLAKKLLDDPKEQAEHKMLVDLHRNDLGRVAKFGTVNVSRFMDIKKFSHVQHISSEITGIISNSQNAFSALASCFPAGTLSGAPKYESMEIINRNEKEARGPYGGALGFFGFNGDCEFAIPIRSLFASGEKAYAQACGGVVYDSTPKKEYEEVMLKLKALDIVLEDFA